MKKVVFLVAGLFFLMAGMAQAGSFTLPSQPATGVTIQDPSGNVGTSAALFDVIFEGNPYEAFCVDYATIGWATYDNFTMIDLPNEAPYIQAAYIYENYGSSNGPVAQLAVWEVVFEQLTDGGAVGDVRYNAILGNNFYVTNRGGFSEDELTLANTYVDAALQNSTNFNASNYRQLVSPDTTNYYGEPIQDFLTKVSVPEPTTMLLLGLGLVGLAGVRRRYNK